MTSTETKAVLFDELMKDVEGFMISVNDHYHNIENVDQDPVLEEARNGDYFSYITKKCGKLQGSNFALAMKVSRFKGIFEYYKQQQSKNN
jgi:hypothetical protein